ncbi:MAG: tetratricopeptide repeat protein, partial [Elusimicrobia bacterium]|nr:tetratricopeptide repeat protein [Elusimicrobiota bacterium]
MKNKHFFLLKTALAALLLAACAPQAGAVDKDAALHFMQGLLYENSGKDAEAFSEYKKALVYDKNAVYIYGHAARAALRSGDYEEALSWCEKLVKAEPAKAENWTLLGGINWAGRNQSAARRAYDKALELDPDNADALYQSASMLSMLDPDKSAEYLNRLIKLNPPNVPEVHYKLALVCYKLGKYDDAVRNLQRAVELAPDYMEARYMLAQFYESRGSTESALGVYLQAADRDPNNPAVLSHIGGMLMSSGKDAEAQVYFEKARAADKGNHEANFGLALLAEKRGDYLGVATYLRGSDTYARDPGLWVRASYYLSRSGALSEAVSNLAQAHLKWPENPEITYFYALGLQDTGKTAEALELLRDLQKKQPDFRDAKLQYAVVSERAGKVQEAERVFRELLEKKPDDAFTLNYLGYMLADRSLKLEEARMLIAKAVALEPDNGAFIDSLGWVEFKLGHADRALPLLRRAGAMENSDPSVWEHLGEAFAAQGRNGDAWFCYRISLNLQFSSRLSKKAAALEKKIPDEEMPRLYARYLQARYGGYDSFSALCKITVKAGLREFYLDGLLRYKAGGGVWLDFMGPMFTPVWTLRLLKDGGADKFEIGDPDFMPEPAEDLRPFAQSVLALLGQYFDGDYQSGAPWKLSGRKLERGGEQVSLGGDDKASIETMLAPGAV